MCMKGNCRVHLACGEMDKLEGQRDRVCIGKKAVRISLTKPQLTLYSDLLEFSGDLV